MQLSEKKMHLDTGSDCKWSQALEEPSQDCTYRERPGAALLAQGPRPAPGHWGRTGPDLLDICDRGLSTGFALSYTPIFLLAPEKREKEKRRDIF